MVKQFEYNFGMKVRLWVDELPKSSFDSCQFIKYKVNTNSGENWKIKSAAIEFYSQRHVSNYGLLGIEVLPALKPRTLNIIIYYANEGECYRDALSYSKKTVFSTLPEEYLETVYQKIQEFCEQNIYIPSGTLVIRVAAHCEVGSSKALFGLITIALLNILLLNKYDLSDEEVQKILEKFLIS